MTSHNMKFVHYRFSVPVFLTYSIISLINISAFIFLVSEAWSIEIKCDNINNLTCHMYFHANGGHFKFKRVRHYLF